MTELQRGNGAYQGIYKKASTSPPVKMIRRSCFPFSVPDPYALLTDSDVREQINRITDGRESQIEQIIVCDMQQSDLLYDKFSMLFRPAKRVIPIKSGFDDTAINEIRRHLPA